MKFAFNKHKYNNTICKFFATLNKSIYKKADDTPIKVELLDILQYGYPESRYLRTKIDSNIVLSNIVRYKGFYESLKMTAAQNNLYSLSSPQVKRSLNVFCIYKDLSDYKWINTDTNKILDSQNYEIVINPRIISASKIVHYEYEECASFNMLKAKAKRPLSIKVAYFDENGIPKSAELFDFEARVFCHEYDHLLGLPIIHWKISEGEVEVHSEDPYENLKVTLEYYKNRLKDSKRNNPELCDMFDNKLINESEQFNEEEEMEVSYDYRNNRNLSYEEVMLIDIEKGIRKDLKLKLKKMTQKV